jgi:hypothetical protein
MEIIEVSVKSKKWGWGYSTQPQRTSTGGLTISIPGSPDYTGTVEQIKSRISQDRTYKSLGGAYHRDMWFYDGRPVAAIEWYFPDDPDDPDGPGHWGFTADLRGFDPDDMTFMGDTFKIKIA